MCGICGKIFIDPRAQVERGLVQHMTDALAHRGPDAEGFHIRGAAGLGHRRLKIIDLAEGKQPMYNEDASLVVVFNGEIYNYLMLRRELQAAGHHFKTNSDTEVLLHGYEQWGKDLLRRLRGMFAFALWDEPRQQLFLGRDQVGIKPLHYYWDGGQFLFASEIKAILQDPSVSRKIDAHALDDYLTYLYVPAPKTIFAGIRKLRPGHGLVVSARGLEEFEYWDLDFSPQNGKPEAELAESIKEALRDSVSSQLMSEVPLGAFLSGGIDSSAVVGMMGQLLDQPVNTASIGFTESAFDELPYARMVAQKYRTNAHEKIVQAEAAQILDTLAWHFDEPFADSSMAPTYYVSQIARERVTVCLSGDGGDENFAGYRRYRFDVFENHLRGFMPQMLRGPLFGMLGKIYPKADWLPQMFRAKTLFTNLSLSPERGYFHTMGWFNAAMKKQSYKATLRQELQGYDPFSAMQAHFARTEGWDPLSRIQYVDIKTYLVDDILTKVDRASMAHGLEVRVPLLDHLFMEHVARIPAEYKLRAGEGKYIFKQALCGIVPHEILYRPKMGFSIPLAQWLRRELKPVFEARVFGPDAITAQWLEPATVRRWWQQHQRGTRDYAYHLWAVLMLECWGRKFIQ